MARARQTVSDVATGAKVRQIADVDTSLMDNVPDGWVTPEGAGKHLISDFENDDLGRNILALGPWHDAIIEDSAIAPKDILARLQAPVVAARVRTARMTLHLDSRHQRWEADGFVTGDEEEGLSWHILGDVRITVTDDSGNTVAQISATPACACGRLGPDTFGRLEQHLPRRKLWTAWTRNLRDDANEIIETRRYHTIPKQGPGFEGEHYLATRYQRDTMDQLVRTLKPDGTIERTVRDQRGLVISRWVGTNDTGATATDPTGNDAPGNNMKPVWLGEYDHGQPDGDGELTEERMPVDDNPANDRVITHGYDERGNRTHTTTTDGTDVFIDVTEFDNLDQPISQTRYHTAVDDANRLEHSETSYDSQQRVYNDRTWGVDPATGNLTQPLDAGTWYDPNSNVIKSTSPGRKAVKKTVFDSLDDPIHRYTVVESDPPPTVPNDVSGDIVISQLDLLRDASRQVIARVLRRRFHDATGTGPLGGPQSSQPRARCFWNASWHDGIGRSLFHAVYGTVPQPAPVDTAAMDLAGWQRPALPPASSDTVLVSRSLPVIGRGPSGGMAPGGRIDLRWTDRLSRQVRTLEAAFTKAQRETRMTWHASGAMHRLILTDPDTGEQVTTWLFGTTLETSSIARNDVVSGKQYPTGETEHFTFNRQSEPVTFQDPNGTVHAYDRDKLARLLHDRVITLADDIDGLVRRLSTAYTLRGQVASVSSHDDPEPGQGTVLNEAAFSYNALRCLIADRQSHDGPVDGSTPEVGYQCSGGVGNTLRRTGIIYPDGRQLGLEYGAAGSIDDALNRVQSLHDETTIAVIAEWQYLGIAMAAKTTLPQPGIQRRWTALPGEDVSDGGDPYVGYDRFDRTQRSLWLKDTGTELQPLSDVAWGYDQAGLRTWRRDRSPGAPEAHQDQAFSYDELYQLTQRQLGNLNVNQTSVNGYAKAAEDFDYDQQGNWNQYQTKEAGQPVIDQTRTHNESNQPSDRIGSEIASPALGAARRAGVAMPCNFRQITKIDGTSAIIAHDKNGNTTLVPTSDPNGPQGNLEGEPVKVIWDAWNRSRKLLDETDQIIWENHYDALTRRIITDDGTTPRHYYYNDQWRCVEERLGTSTDAERQHIWNPRNRWDLILRDRDTNTNGTLDEHLWCITDDLDPIAIADHTGSIVERYVYSAFGMPSILTPVFEPRSGNQSDFDWNFLFHAEFADPVTGWMNYGYRSYVPVLGRWLGRDPIGEGGAASPYGFSENSGGNSMDLLGLVEWFFVGPEKPSDHKRWGAGSLEANEAGRVSGQNMQIMAAFTDGVPDWTPESGGINTPSNVLQPGDEYSDVYLILVTRQSRPWQDEAGEPEIDEDPRLNSVVFAHRNRSPHLVQKFRLRLDENDGTITLEEIDPPSRWLLESQSTRNGTAGAVASQLKHYKSHGVGGVYGRRMGFIYSGGGGWSRQGIVSYRNHGMFDMDRYEPPTGSGERRGPVPPLEKFARGVDARGNEVEVGITDRQRYTDRNVPLPTISLEIESGCR